MGDRQRKAAIVTGAGSGFGRAAAKRFAADGYTVTVADVDASAAGRVAEEIGHDAIAVRVDVRDAASVAEMVSATMDAHGRLDVLVNNAGLTRRGGPIEDTADSEWEFVFDVNVKGVYLCMKHSIPFLRRDGGGVILNVSSIAALIPRRNAIVYSTSKGAVITMTRAAAVELAPEIRVNCICPAPADTNFLAGRAEGDAEVLQSMRAAMLSSHNIPLGRLVLPQDVAASLAFLASESASYLSGVIMPVDGARTAGNPS